MGTSGGVTASATPSASVFKTAGNYTLNAAAWTNVDTTLDLTLAAVVGDIIEYTISGLLGIVAHTQFLDVVTIVSGAAVNSLSTRGAPVNQTGVQAWIGSPTQTSYTLLAGGPMYPVVAGDLSGGNVTLRLRHMQDVAAARTLFATAADPLLVMAKNLRH